MSILPPVRADERQRLAALHAFDILDSEPEREFDALVRTATLVFGTQTALVSLVDRDRQWFKAREGLEACETSRDLSFCAWAVYDRRPLIVPDAHDDPRFADHPLVLGDPKIRFYAGAPLLAPNGHALGSFCVIDPSPRPDLDGRELEILANFAAQTVALMEARTVSRELARALRTVRELAPMIPICSWCRDIRNDDDYWQSIHDYLLEHAGTLTSHAICPTCLEKLDEELDGTSKES